MLVVANPVVTGAEAGWLTLIAGYLLPAALAALALRRPATRDAAPLLGGYAVMAGGMWIILAIRRAFHPDGALSGGPVGDGEQWAYSGAGLAYGGALLALGIRQHQRALRRAALAIAERVERGVGARGLLETEPFARRLRDLRMYLRQPAIDATLGRVARSALAPRAIS